MSENRKQSFGEMIQEEWNKLSYNQQEEAKEVGALVLMIVFFVVVILMCSWFLLGLAGSGGFGYAVAFMVICLSLGANLAHWLRK